MSAPTTRRPGQDPRIATFRGALEALLESLDATVRVARWQQADGEAIPEPLQDSASRLVQRLGSATRLTTSRFVGAPALVTMNDAIRSAVSALDVAYVAYRKQVDSSAGSREEAAIALDAEIGRVKTQAHLWE